ncbi:hypothetical protein [Labrys neptuniae]
MKDGWVLDGQSAQSDGDPGVTANRSSKAGVDGGGQILDRTRRHAIAVEPRRAFLRVHAGVALTFPMVDSPGDVRRQHQSELATSRKFRVAMANRTDVTAYRAALLQGRLEKDRTMSVTKNFPD